MSLLAWPVELAESFAEKGISHVWPSRARKGVLPANS